MRKILWVAALVSSLLGIATAIGADYYTASGSPATGSALSSATMRGEFSSIAAGFTKIAPYSGNGGKIVGINAGATAQEAVAVTGTGSVVRATSPTLVTPDIGTPTAGVATNLTGTAAGLTVGTATTATGANALYSATTTVNVSSATAPSAGQVLKATSSTAATWQAAVSVSMQSFTSSGTYTPTSGMKYAVVHMVGGGGGGATLAAGNYGGGGGGAGEYATGVYTAAQVGASQVVTIGAGGAANASGGTTSLGALLTAVGGTGAASAVGLVGGTGGTGTGLHSPGGAGFSGDFANTVPQALGGQGGGSWFGSGGRGGQGGADAGQAAGAYGSGGGGGGYNATWSAGGAGASGAIVIYEYQ